MSGVYRMLIVGLLSISANAEAESLFDFNASTPAGSWVLREVTTTNHRGRQKATIIKQKKTLAANVARAMPTFIFLCT